jgi:hypothetical protein
MYREDGRIVQYSFNKVRVGDIIRFAMYKNNEDTGRILDELEVTSILPLQIVYYKKDRHINFAQYRYDFEYFRFIILNRTVSNSIRNIYTRNKI